MTKLEYVTFYRNKLGLTAIPIKRNELGLSDGKPLHVKWYQWQVERPPLEAQLKWFKGNLDVAVILDRSIYILEVSPNILKPGSFQECIKNKTLASTGKNKLQVWLRDPKGQIISSYGKLPYLKQTTLRKPSRWCLVPPSQGFEFITDLSTPLAEVGNIDDIRNLLDPLFCLNEREAA